MMRNLLIMSLLFMAFVTPLYAETGKVPEPSAVLRGQKVYTDNCLVCHLEKGKGENIPIGFIRPGFRPAIPLNEDSHAWHHGDDQLAEIIRRGNQRMPAFAKILPSQQIADVIAYVKSLWSQRILGCQGPRHMSCM